MGTRLLEGLKNVVGRSPVFGEVHGQGLMVCAEFVEPDGSPSSTASRGSAVRSSASGSVVRLAPPLCITAAEVDHFVAIVADSISAMEKSARRRSWFGGRQQLEKRPHANGRACVAHRRPTTD
jgi:4-aminobutyrate aminotransferase-like enzyme